MTSMPRLLPFLLPALLAACAVRVEAPPQRVLPGHFDQVPAQGAADVRLSAWWLGWNDPVMTGLIEQGLANSNDLKAAEASLREARALAVVVDSALYPNLGAHAGGQRGKAELRQPHGLPRDTAMVTDYLAGVAAVWEVDIFGGRRSDAAAASEAAAAMQQRLYGVRMLVAADIAEAYLQERGLQARLRVLQASIDASDKLLRYARGRFGAGQVTRYDVDRAQAQAENIRAQQPLLVSQFDVRLRRLAVLTGQPAQALRTLPEQPPTVAVPDAPGGIVPSEVLARRPDVRAHAHEVSAYAARLGSARAEWFPRFSLSFLLRDGRLDVAGLPALQGSAGLFGVGVTLPIFTAGRIAANVEAADARLQAALARYDQSILDALQDVDNAYGMRRGLDEREQLLLQAAGTARRNATQAGRLYDAGRQTLQEVLEAQLDSLHRDDELAQVRTARAQVTVKLYQALGGGWNDTDTPRSGE
ncbi:efflux transporter, outer membrane factor lipoprotein, NodT family [Bordetella holmesii CDC-H643-BH]|nr:TolC family protein [Bordetella holmesii]EWM47335.1 efflux transporter, outer membrane factor (OMF) lipo, NodT family protein [Bordetella holmesii 35009]KAK70991.1 efflux transporter, outer membrane factor lipoprotein, NodT family [Bordetella holmesii H620]KCV01203.1 efflux transporter, outer membrane factor lipoprotein, NodT family [Bordetella holmesii CDC-H629-BH]KCV19191.1 efflux transporter, outer membrane factor lipoprotein, NodT family [Bordetella holmesii CDC-H643-BH]SUV92015.1 outer